MSKPSFANSNIFYTSKKADKTKNTDNSNFQNKNVNEIGYVVFENGASNRGQILYSRLHFLSPIPPKSKLNPRKIQIIHDEQSSSEIKPGKINNSYFSLGVGYSPDFSTVGIGNFIAPGSRWTIIAEYSFLNRFSINTGVVFVSNQYEAYGKDYNAPPKYWKNGIEAEETYGECKMVDIPLNLRYDVLVESRHKLFISGGASTYFLLKEDYYFQYEQDDPDLPDHWGTDKTTVYPFGIVNISVGYQYMFGRKCSLQVEPFIKIPTTGIGWGNVDLHTIGTYLTYKYRIGK